MRICPVCGKDFYDASRNHSKVTCSNSCRTKLCYADPQKHLNRSVEMRLNAMRRDYDVKFDKETIEQIKADLKLQKCMICGRERKEGEKDFHIDHDHITGKYRGILCPLCNLGIGHSGDSPMLLDAWARYLEKHNARGIDWLGWKRIFQHE